MEGEGTKVFLFYKEGRHKCAYLIYCFSLDASCLSKKMDCLFVLSFIM